MSASREKRQRVEELAKVGNSAQALRSTGGENLQLTTNGQEMIHLGVQKTIEIWGRPSSV